MRKKESAEQNYMCLCSQIGKLLIFIVACLMASVAWAETFRFNWKERDCLCAFEERHLKNKWGN